MIDTLKKKVYKILGEYPKSRDSDKWLMCKFWTVYYQSRINRHDSNDKECSIQKSSSADEDCIWLGCNKIGLKKFDPDNGGWSDVQLEHNPPEGVLHIANTRMHLNQEQVARLLPILQHFVNTGEINANDL